MATIKIGDTVRIKASANTKNAGKVGVVENSVYKGWGRQDAWRIQLREGGSATIVKKNVELYTEPKSEKKGDAPGGKALFGVIERGGEGKDALMGIDLSQGQAIERAQELKKKFPTANYIIFRMIKEVCAPRTVIDVKEL